MATFVKGSAVPNATAYELYRVNGDEGYIAIDRKLCGEVKCTDKGQITQDGTLMSFDKWVNSGFIDVTDLANNDKGYCTRVNGYEAEYVFHLGFYADKNYALFVGGKSYRSDDYVHQKDHKTTITAEEIKSLAEEYGAKYVIICSDTAYEGCEELLVTFTNEINFRLDDLGLPFGTHSLLVKAIGEGDVDLDGDGIIYEDSEYGGDVNGDPLLYDPSYVMVDITDQFEFTESRMISATDGKISTYSGWVSNENYVDISAYSEIEIKMSKTSSTGTGTGLALYDADKNFVSGIPHTDGVATYGTMVKIIKVTDNIKYVRTTYWSTSNANYREIYGGFYCKAVLKTTA